MVAWDKTASTSPESPYSFSLEDQDDELARADSEHYKTLTYGLLSAAHFIVIRILK